MATFEENIQFIRTTGVYGPDIRQAIAEALTQAGDHIQTVVSGARTNITGDIVAAEAAITSAVNTAVSTMDTKVSTAKSDINQAVSQVEGDIQDEVDRIETKVDERNLYMQVSKITGTEDEYLLTILNPT